MKVGKQLPKPVAQAFHSTRTAADITLALIQKRNFEKDVVSTCNLPEVKERAQVMSVKIKGRKNKKDIKEAIIFQTCVLSKFQG